MAVYEWNGAEVELPKLTLALDDALDRALDRSRPKRDRAKDAHKLLRDVLGADLAAERLGGGTLDAVDVSALWLALGEVEEAYRGGVEDAEMRRVMARLEEAVPMLDKMAQIVPALGSRQGFKRVL